MQYVININGEIEFRETLNDAQALANNVLAEMRSDALAKGEWFDEPDIWIARIVERAQNVRNDEYVDFEMKPV